jgi:peroxiredoxin/Tfp pilus assembly protein PilF
VDSTSAAAFKRVHMGDQAPSFTLPDLNGNPVSLDAHKDGPLTIVTFWALWSPKSEPLLRDIQKILDEFGGRGLSVEAVAVNEDGENAPADFADQVMGLIQRNGLKFPVVVDQAMEEYARWGVIAAPSTAFLGKDLKVEYEFSGHPTSAYQDMRDQVMRVLGIEEEVATAAKPKRERYQAEHRVLLNFGLSKTLFERGQFSKAERKIRKVLSDDPNFPDAHALSGAIHLGLAQGGEAGAGQKAREAFAKAVELDGTVPLGLIGLAHFTLEDGDVAKALELAQKAAEYTEDEVLGQLETEDQESVSGAIEAPVEQVETKSGNPQPTPGETPAAEQPGDAAAPTVQAPDAAETQAPEAAGVARLEQAAAALQSGDADGAKTLLSEFVSAYLAVPEGPKMSEKGLKMKMMMMKKQAQ